MAGAADVEAAWAAFSKAISEADCAHTRLTGAAMELGHAQEVYDRKQDAVGLAVSHMYRRLAALSKALREAGIELPPL